jgi:outer membrane protein assembly factor BamE (lipoprotein component of BamABCDE complex)
MKRKTKILTVLAGLLVCGVAFTLFFLFSEAVPKGRFAQVSNGMSREQIRELLGKPDYERVDASHGSAFCYGGFQHLKWCSAEIYFGADGRVTGKFHDH